MATPDASIDHYRVQQRIGAITASAVSRLWERMGDDFDASYAVIESKAVQLLATGQEAAARTGAAYLEQVLYETGQVDLPIADVDPAAFAGTASDGRSLEGLLRSSVTKSKVAVGGGATVPEALRQGRNDLVMNVLTQVADANRAAVSAGIGMRPAVQGFVRMLNPPSCSRCVVLAGKFYRWNEGFRRHPRCDCRHIPSSENVAGDFRTDPYEYFKSLTESEQEKAFGRIEARAIRDGADIYRIENTKLRGLATGGKQAVKYGTPQRLTIDEIYRQAGTRTNAIKLMSEEGYITGPQVAGGNIIGLREGFGQLGKGGKARAASDAVQAAREAGVREPLNRYTMTAAERRLYDANFRMQEATRGYWPNSIGANSADKYNRTTRITPQQKVLVEAELQKQLDALPNQPQQVRDLAVKLGLL